MTEIERAFYKMDLITDIKAVCEKSENLNKELKRKEKQLYNNFLIHARKLSDHIDKNLPIEENETVQSMIDVKYNLTLEMKKQFTR
tara:strand:- start:286 stop:543 length:258 start_codon:yes stop_codon:yes gene_type:complete